MVYRKTAKVNWDPVDNTVLANEQVIDGKGWRSGATVEQRDMDQWFYKITNYAEDLLEGLKGLDRWPEKVRTMQANWIGKSEGLQMTFEWEHRDQEFFDKVLSKNPENRSLEETAWTGTLMGLASSGISIFTTRPDTLFGASFLAISPDHEWAKFLDEQNVDVRNFRAECAKIGTSEEAIAQAPKLGLDTGLRVKHPFDESITLPVWIANFVLMGYGTGAVFGCPAHDQRDLDFARKYDLPVTPVVLPEGENANDFQIGDEAYTGEGKIYNSSFLNGLNKTCLLYTSPSPRDPG